MDALAKLFKKLPPEEQRALLQLLKDIANAEKRRSLEMKKLSGGEFYRVRKGNFRVIFHFENDDEVVIDAIRLRNEKTYRGF